MRPFPTSSIDPIKAILGGAAGNASLEVALHSFEINGESVRTSIRLDGIEIPFTDLPSLSGLEFDFPVNPAPGYIDGSIYLAGAHHPVDVTRLSFTDCTVSISGILVFEYEGLDGYANAPFSVTTSIESKSPRQA